MRLPGRRHPLEPRSCLGPVEDLAGFREKRSSFRGTALGDQPPAVPSAFRVELAPFAVPCAAVRTDHRPSEERTAQASDPPSRSSSWSVSRRSRPWTGDRV